MAREAIFVSAETDCCTNDDSESEPSLGSAKTCCAEYANSSAMPHDSRMILFCTGPISRKREERLSLGGERIVKKL